MFASQRPFNPQHHSPGAKPYHGSAVRRQQQSMSREQPDDTPKDQRIPRSQLGSRQMA